MNGDSNTTGASHEASRLPIWADVTNDACNLSTLIDVMTDLTIEHSSNPRVMAQVAGLLWIARDLAKRVVSDAERAVLA